MEYITLKNGVSVPKLGLGTWYLGEKLSAREEEIRALQTGIEQGMTLIDTAEMYGGTGQGRKDPGLGCVQF